LFIEREGSVTWPSDAVTPEASGAPLGALPQTFASRLGTAQEMLSEETVTIDGQAYLVGNSREYVKLAVPLSALGGDCAVNCLYRGTAENFLNSEILLLTNVSKT